MSAVCGIAEVLTWKGQRGMILCVGLAGSLGLGKGSVADILSTLAREQGLKVAYYSLSDEV